MLAQNQKHQITNSLLQQFCLHSGKSYCRSGQCFQLWFYWSPSSSVLFTRSLPLQCACPAGVYQGPTQEELNCLFKINSLQSLRNLVSPVNLSGRNSSHGLSLRLGHLPVHRLLDSSAFSHSLWASSSYFLLPFWSWQRACVCYVFIILWGRKGVVWASDKRLTSPLLFTKAK